jgi:hypothetical protein
MGMVIYLVLGYSEILELKITHEVRVCPSPGSVNRFLQVKGIYTTHLQEMQSMHEYAIIAGKWYNSFTIALYMRSLSLCKFA